MASVPENNTKDVNLQTQQDASSIFCHGEILDVVQRSEIFPDSKTFVDMYLLSDAVDVLQDFRNLPNHSTEKLKEFLDRNFDGPGGELQEWIPGDWSESPAVLARVADPELRRWAANLNQLWKILGRQVVNVEHPERHTLLPLPNPFMVPGDRFREVYYWDSYWIVGGLLTVDMVDTAKGMIENLLSLVDRYGFVPNGSRLYYTSRSQPPLLTPMVDLYHKKTNDKDFLSNNIALMEKEHRFWIEHRSVSVKSKTSQSTHQVARYYADRKLPRPEGYITDIAATEGMTAEAACNMYRHIASACESGWDFSTRWFSSNSTDFKSIKTEEIIPVDLNVYLCWTEQLLSKYHDILGDQSKAEEYRQLAEARKFAIDDLLWNDNHGIWFDFDLMKKEQRIEFYPSNVFPLLANCTKLDLAADKTVNSVLKYLNSTGVLQYPGGVPTSLVSSDQQWDFPNAWSPLIHFIIESLTMLPGAEAAEKAEDLARKWVLSNYTAWKKFGHMYEKYDAEKAGAAGGGGEYNIQIGFGWTNGVVLMLLNKYNLWEITE